MAIRYTVKTYRPATCSNEECERHGDIIPFDEAYVRDAEVGESWRTYCVCGDGAGWTLTKVESIDDIQIDEVVLEVKMQLTMENVPVGDGMLKPYWQHDCTSCEWLGSRAVRGEFGVSYEDFYVCLDKEKELPNGSAIVRVNNTGGDYHSMPIYLALDWAGDDESCMHSVLKRKVEKHLAHIEYGKLLRECPPAANVPE